MAKLANVSVVRPKHPGLNFGVDRIFYYSVFIIIEFKSVGHLLLSTIS
jgi:hypothetical protein